MRDSLPLLNGSVAEFARRLSSGDPTPGGGSAAALSGALGASLVAMVANLTLGRPAYAEHEPEVRKILDRAELCRDRLLGLIDRDAAAYAAVIEARRISRAEPARELTLTAATAEAIRIPMRIARTAGEVMQLAAGLAAIGNRNALSDVAVAADLARSGVRGGVANVGANLPSLPVDHPLREEVPPVLATIESLVEASGRAVETALAARRAE
jgi:formiminotetrahydrofolate cyclodeaminase